MLCKKPIVLSGRAFGCGQCIPCRINKRRLWARRLSFEADQHQFNAFLTLTYDVGHKPLDGSLDPDHTRRWLYRIRKAARPEKLRFFLVGEYGDQSLRPHYHAILFGFPACQYGATRTHRAVCCANCDVVQRSWGHGKIQSMAFDQGALDYICGYVTKKLTKADDERLVRPWGRIRAEFARMSLRPGIGATAIVHVAERLREYDFCEPDVPAHLLSGKSPLFLGRYLRDRLRKEFYGDDEKVAEAKAYALARSDVEMLPVRKAAFDASVSLASEIVKVNLARSGQLENKARLYRKRQRL